MKYSYLTAIASIFFLSMTLHGQDEASLKTFITEFYQSVSNASKEGVEADFQSYFARDFQGTDVEVDLGGEVEVASLDYNSNLEYYNRFRKVSGLSISFNVTKFNTVAIKGNTGVASFEVDFTLSKGGSTMSKGQQTVSLTARSSGDNWKISFINRLYVQSEVYMGSCVCDVYSQGDNNFATFLTVPDGDSYQTSSDRFEIIETTNKRVIRYNGTENFVWNKETDEISQGDLIVGTAKLSETAIKMILKSLNEDHCQTVISQ